MGMVETRLCMVSAGGCLQDGHVLALGWHLVLALSWVPGEVLWGSELAMER